MIPEPIVILGGGGFIGSNLAKWLDRSGYRHVRQVDVAFEDWRYSQPCWRYELDLRYPKAAEYAIDGAATVFHFAADMGGVEYFHSSSDFGASLDNQMITTNVLRAVQPGQRLLYSSSVCAYPTELMNAGILVNEDNLLYGTPDAMYGADKRNGAYWVSHAPIDGRVMMFDTIYGPGQEHEGRKMKFPAAVATKAIASLETGDLPLFGDGSQKRCYLYIDDAIDRITQLAAASSVTLPGGIWNVGATQLVTCKDIAQMCLDYVGSSATISYDRSKPTGVLTRRTDQLKFAMHFGEQDETPPEEGFEHFIDWLLTL